MNQAQKLYHKLQYIPFSYGETVSTILEQQGKSISNLPNEDFMFPDKSIIRVTNTGIQILEYITE